MKKKALLLFVVSFFMLGLTQSALGEKPLSITLKDALIMGIESNSEIRMAALKLDNAKLDLEKTKAANALTVSRHTDLQYELSRVRAVENYRQTKDKVFLEIAQGYLNILKSEAEKGLRAKEVELEEKSLKEFEAQVGKGYKTHLELLQQRNRYHSALLALKKAEKNHLQLYWDLQLKLGVEAGLELMAVTPPSEWLGGVEEAVELAVKNSLDLQSVALEVEMAKIDLERAEIGSTLELERKKLQNSLEVALLNKEKSTTDLVGSVQRQYASLYQAEEEFFLNEANLAIVEENYRMIQRQEAAGLVSQLDLLSAEKEILQARYQNLVAIANYYLEKWRLQQLIGLELEV